MLQKLRDDLTRELSRVGLLLVNADGFITESHASVVYLPNNHSKTGNPATILRELGVESVAFSRREHDAISSVAVRLGIGFLHQGILRKSELYSKIKQEQSVSDAEIAFIGFEESDLPIIQNVNFSVATADAPLEVKSECYYVTFGAGEEAVREIAELIIKAKRYPDGWSE